MHDIDLWIWPLIGLTFTVILRYFVFQFPNLPDDRGSTAFLLFSLIVMFPIILFLWDQDPVPDFFDFLADITLPWILYMVGVLVAVETVNCGLCD